MLAGSGATHPAVAASHGEAWTELPASVVNRRCLGRPGGENSSPVPAGKKSDKSQYAVSKSPARAVHAHPVGPKSAGRGASWAGLQ